VLLLVIITLFCVVSEVYALSLFSDDFESLSINNWQIVNGAWTIQNDQYNNHWVTEVSLPSSDSEIQAGDYNWSDYELSFDMLSKYGVDRTAFFRVNNQRTSIAKGHDLPISYSV